MVVLLGLVGLPLTGSDLAPADESPAVAVSKMASLMLNGPATVRPNSSCTFWITGGSPITWINPAGSFVVTSTSGNSAELLAPSTEGTYLIRVNGPGGVSSWKKDVLASAPLCP